MPRCRLTVGPGRVLLVANYKPDAQQSMQRFAAVLEGELTQRGLAVTVLAPAAVFGALRAGRSGLGKWLGYVDKFLLFPWTLRRAVRNARRAGDRIVVHVCDHSNAIYTRYLHDVPHLVTCNDLLAVRSALGDTPQHRTRWSGRLLQRLILDGLNRAAAIACISDATRQDVLRLTSVDPARVERAYMGLNHPYRPVARADARRRVGGLVPDRPFVLHVGGNQWYKNRLGVLRTYAALAGVMPGRSCPALVMVGEPFSPAMRAFVEANDLAADVIELPGVPNAGLEALYSLAEVLFFPSFAEGFGWPVLEAMACRCRVVTSNRAPMTEVAGDAADFIDPEEPLAAAATLAAVLAEPQTERAARLERGAARAALFSTDAMVDAYLALYRRALPC